MKSWEIPFYAAPETLTPLRLMNPAGAPDDCADGALVDDAGRQYRIDRGLPNFILDREIAGKAKDVQTFYDGRSETYDQYLHLTFYTHGEDEQKVRNGFVELLGLKPDSKVLEVAAGSGRDSEIIASRLDAGGRLFLQDISPGMLEKARAKLAAQPVPVSFSLGSASNLPYFDDTFDCVYSFGGLGEFPDIKAALAEMVRVCKPGGKIVVGDESIPVWLRNTEFAKILSTTNPQFLAPLPLEHMPVQAREVCVRWVIGGVFYLIDFKVAAGAPTANFDYPVPGPRGGTLRTRHEGQLEGVTAEAKELAHKAREKKGLSMHAWLDAVVRDAAKRDLSS
jgi:ubiquinone/menaquinone biosynthesis C-methylase UbiE